MKKRLSDLISQAKQPETYLSDQQVMDLIGSGKEVDIPKVKSYRPNRIPRFFKPLILIVMTTLIAVFSLILILSPAKDIPDTKVPFEPPGMTTSAALVNDDLQIRDTSQELIPQNPVKSKLKIKSGQPEKEQSPKMTDTRGVLSMDEYDSIVYSKIDWALETKKLGIRPIELDSATISCIGFNVAYGSFEVLWQGPDQFDRSISLIISSHEFHIGWTTMGWVRRTPAQYAAFRMKPVKFIALSTFGEKKPIIKQHFYGSQLDPTSFDKLLNISIPISLKGFHPTQKYEKCIFWLVPTEELINCLPDSIREPMSREFNRNIKPVLDGLTDKDGKPVDIDTTRYALPADELADQVPCQYFPSFCEGLPGLDNLRVYPIPTSDFLNIEILLLQSKKITYRLFDISGRLLNDKLPTKDYLAPGQYTEKIDLSDLNPGLYLLVLIDSEGARMTRRILKN